MSGPADPFTIRRWLLTAQRQFNSIADKVESEPSQFVAWWTYEAESENWREQSGRRLVSAIEGRHLDMGASREVAEQFQLVKKTGDPDQFRRFLDLMTHAAAPDAYKRVATADRQLTEENQRQYPDMLLVRELDNRRFALLSRLRSEGLSKLDRTLGAGELRKALKAMDDAELARRLQSALGQFKDGTEDEEPRFGGGYIDNGGRYVPFDGAPRISKEFQRANAEARRDERDAKMIGIQQEIRELVERLEVAGHEALGNDWFPFEDFVDEWRGSVDELSRRVRVLTAKLERNRKPKDDDIPVSEPQVTILSEDKLLVRVGTRQKTLKSNSRLKVIKFLMSRRPERVGLKELINSTCGDADKYLREMARNDAEWKRVLLLPNGKKGMGYGIL